MAIDHPPYSRFKEVPLTVINGIETVGVWEPPKFDGPDIILVVDSTYEGRPDKISNDYYETTEYAWVIMTHNNVRNTLNWPKIGEVIKLPSSYAIAKELL